MFPKTSFSDSHLAQTGSPGRGFSHCCHLNVLSSRRILVVKLAAMLRLDKGMTMIPESSSVGPVPTCPGRRWVAHLIRKGSLEMFHFHCSNNNITGMVGMI